MGVTEKLLARIRNLEAENTRLNEEADWLATWCANACAIRSGNCDGCAFNEQSICATEDNESQANTPEKWREAAKKAVKDETNA